MNDMIMPEQELNEKWSIHKVVQEAIKTAHGEPAPETKARLKILETNQERLMEKIDNLEEKIDDILLKITALPKEIFDEADKKYASKLVEKVVYSIAGAVGLAVVYAVLNIIIKK